MMIAFIAKQLQDPSSLLHAVGILLLVGEVAVWHWVLGHPVDVGAVGAGLSLVGCGVASDRLGVSGPTGA